MSEKGDWQRALVQLPLERVDGCNLCGASNSSIDERWASLLCLQSPFAVRRCGCCGLRWLDPRPSAEGYERLYSEAMYFGGSGASPDNYARLVSTRRAYYASRVRMVAGILGRGRLNILDFGAASGDFVAIARAQGHFCEGIELSADARQAALTMHGIKLLSGAEAENLPSGEMDVVHMNHVLEHMPDPLAHLRWCRERLSSSGLLIIEVPQQLDNALDRLRRLFRVGGRQSRFDAYSLHHTYFFSPQNLAKLCKQAGLTVASCRTFNPAAAPLWPPSFRNWVLHALLRAADVTHAGGNIIEVVAVPDPDAKSW
jgi:2-polyprenyl-3-methyl-5-hydroxy-6-metoxy-1,4-benzoquinol methylase